MPKSSKPRKPHARHKTAERNHRLDRRPHPFHAMRTFWPIYQIFADMRKGELDAVGGKPIMQAWGDRERYEVAPAIEGWASCWQRISDGEGLELDLSPLLQIARYLNNGVMLTPELIDKAERVTQQCQSIYLQMPRGKSVSYSNTELIAEEFNRIASRSNHNCERHLAAGTQERPAPTRRRNDAC